MHRLALSIALATACCVATARADDAGLGADRGPLYTAGIAYTGERWSVVDGGLARGGAYLDNLDLYAELNGERAFGVPGLKFYAYALYDNGHAFDGRYVGSANGISNIEADEAWRLFEAWADLPLAGGSLRVGLYNLNSEFDVNETGALFLNPAHGIGTDVSQSGLNGPSIFPATSFGARYAFDAADWEMRLAVLDGVPGDPERPHRTAIRFDAGDGALLAAEASRAVGAGRIVLGAWHYTAKFDDLARTDADGAPLRRRGSSGAYGLVEGRVFAEREDEAQGLSMFVRIGVADADVNAHSAYLGVGAVYTGALPERPRDQLGLALAHARTGRPWRTAAALAGVPAATGETNLELAYRLELADGFYLQPDLQYVIDPGASREVANAWVMGLRFRSEWGWER
jgi:porin